MRLDEARRAGTFPTPSTGKTDHKPLEATLAESPVGANA
jgi:hypothetical protein